MISTTPALVVSEFHQTPVFNNLEIASLGENQALLKVNACGLNFADLLLIEGKYQETPIPPFAPGLEVMGIVEAVGGQVTDLNIGDRVAAYCGAGGLAGHVVVDTAQCLPISDSMDDVTAAGFQIAYATSHLALKRRARLQEGETLVVLGAAGGVGLTTVEIGKALGANVIAVARGTQKLEIASAAGADHLLDSETDDLYSQLKSIAPIHVVYDAVGGKAGEAALRSLVPEGRYLLIGFASGELPELKPNHLLVKNLSVEGFNLGAYRKFNPAALSDSLTELIGWYEAGRIKPHVSHILPFEKALEGLELLRARKSTGKIVITL